MLRLLNTLLFTTLSVCAFCQHSVQFYVKDSRTQEALPGATAMSSDSVQGATADQDGFLKLENLKAGLYSFSFSFIGYQPKTLRYDVPQQQSDTTIVYLEELASTLDEITVSATRSSRTIDDLAIRVETITAGELEEKAVMQPSNIRMLLTESTGIQTQQTSATSASTSIRIQGLDGKYTQMLRDGFPLYSGFASGLSILQIPPLDLKRVEVIKGSASTLYGGGAIAGLINLVTKEPSEKREVSFLANTNQTKALDLSTYYSEKYGKWGITLYAGRNSQKEYDSNDDGFSDIPQFRRYTLNPRVFYYAKNTTVSLGLNTSFEDRTGGDMRVIDGHQDAVHTYFERNKSERYSSQFKIEKRFSKNSILTIKNSVGYFDRKISLTDYKFAGKQLSTFTEVNHVISNSDNEWIVGGNLWTDNFNQLNASTAELDYGLNTGGVFIQNNHTFSERVSTEAGMRVDYNSQKKVFGLPRISLLYKFNEKLSSRIGGGLGYKPPTIFSEEAESKSFRNIAPLVLTDVKAEKSMGGNVDFNYKTQLSSEADIAINQLFFYTVLNDPLILGNTPGADGNYHFANASGKLQSSGFETNVRIGYNDFSLYLGYTYINAKRIFDGVPSVNPLTAHNRINANILYELEGSLRIAYEIFYIGSQFLSNGEKTRDYWVMGISGEKMFGKFSLFLNAENFLDSRQSRYEAMYTGSIQQPIFREIYSPIDGFIFNGGFRIRL